MKKGYRLLIVIAALSLLLSGCQVITPSKKSYTITWKNYDGAVLEVDEKVTEGEMPTFDGANPAKKEDAQYSYIWTGWTPEVKAADSDTEYIATFKEEKRKYIVTWKNYDGTVLKTDEVLYGVTPEYGGDAPTRNKTNEHVYTFESWSPAVVPVIENTTYTASFKEEARKYNVTWKNEDGTVLRVDEVAYGETPSYGDEVPTKASTDQYSYSFKEWTPAIGPVTGDIAYGATYTSAIRKYTVTWVNDDGTVLEKDEDVTYGTLPSYNGDTPTKANDRALKYTFKGWSPSFEYVTSDQTYTATYDSEGFFSFEPIEYEMQPGYSLANITGAPWINSNVKGEINKIKKPSLKDDFYASVNYDAIKAGSDGVFGECDNAVKEAFNSIYDGTASNSTTNGLATRTLYQKIANGDLNIIKSELAAVDAQEYLSSKSSFTSQDSMLRIFAYNDGYQVELNDGYINSNIETIQFLNYYSSGNGKNVLSYLSSYLDLDFVSSDVDDICSFDASMISQSLNSYYQSGFNVSSYTVNTVSWAPMKSALLDLGLPSNTKIYIKNLYKNCLNTIYNNYYTNNTELLRKAIVSRLAFDYRFLIGINNYKNINRELSNLPQVFTNENSLYLKDNDSLTKNLARLCAPIAFEQSYIELDSSEEIKNQVSELIDEILAGYKELAQTSWLGTTTKNRMIKKLTYMKNAACYSDGHKCFPKFVDNTTSSKTSYQIYKAYANAELDQRIAKTADTDGYFNSMHSYVTNAFYSPSENVFVILNALASHMLGNSIEEKYGMLGAVIGHEITHAFDSSGSYYDENGNYNDWWTSSDRSKFNTKVNKMISFYNRIHIRNDLTVNGNNVNGEATADMGGVKVALLLASKVDGFDYDKFFRAYANVWCSKTIYYGEIEGRAQDEHPFNYLRTNVTLAQFDEFVETYDIQPGDGMYIPEDQRVKIW